MIYSTPYRFFVGWDTSKESLNYCVRDLSGSIILEGEVQNSTSSIRDLLRHLTQLQNSVSDPDGDVIATAIGPD
jgi:hypothetical protein